MTNQHASLPFPISYSYSALHENKMLLSLKGGGKKERECTGDQEIREGENIAHETIWVFPASSSRFGTKAVFFSSSSLLHTLSVLCTHALFIVAFINNLIEKQG